LQGLACKSARLEEEPHSGPAERAGAVEPLAAGVWQVV